MSVYQDRIYADAKKDLIQVSGIYGQEKKLKFLARKVLKIMGFPTSQQLDELSKSNYFYVLVQPSPVLKNYKHLARKYSKVSNHTILIELQSEETLWKNLEKKSARWGVKIAEKNRLVFRNAEEKDIDKFYNIYKSTSLSGGFEAEKKEYLRKLRNTEISQLFLIESKKKIVAGGLILIDIKNNYSILDITAATEKGQKLQAMPFLYWNLIKYSNSIGLKYFDLGGYDIDAKKGDKIYNINKFKERFGGKIIEQPIFSSNWRYPFLRRALKILRKIK
jgi:lipid II:glycine glycyltransferase (peptidoglycan interpeptide bridge formation enzyme)